MFWFKIVATVVACAHPPPMQFWMVYTQRKKNSFTWCTERRAGRLTRRRHSRVATRPARGPAKPNPWRPRGPATPRVAASGDAAFRPTTGWPRPRWACTAQYDSAPGRSWPILSPNQLKKRVCKHVLYVNNWKQLCTQRCASILKILDKR